MKKRMFAIPMMLVLAATFTGCATTGELEKMQAEQQMLDAKVAQALQDAQAAKAAADAAKFQADDATARAESVEKAALERERIAEEKAQEAEAAFAKSMRK